MRLLWLAASERQIPTDPCWLTPVERERADGMRFAKRRNDCVVGLGDTPVGCDLELVEPRSRIFVRDYFTASESDWVDEADGGEDWDVRANLLWSAKESALKVLRTGL